MSCPVKPNWFLFAQKLIFEISLTYTVCTTLVKTTAFVSSPKVSACSDWPQLSLHELWIQPVQVIKEPALCFSFCLGVTRDKAHDYSTHSLTSTWVGRSMRNQMMQQSLWSGHCRGISSFLTGKVPLGPASHGWHENGPTNTPLQGQGWSLPQGTSSLHGQTFEPRSQSPPASVCRASPAVLTLQKPQLERSIQHLKHSTQLLLWAETLFFLCATTISFPGKTKCLSLFPTHRACLPGAQQVPWTCWNWNRFK